MALGVGPGDRVVTLPTSSSRPREPSRGSAATPVFCDIDPRHFGLDAAKLATLSLDGVKAVVPVHLYGHVIDLDPMVEAARGVPILEDAAQAIGARDRRGRIAGEWGAVAAWSFFPTKNLGGRRRGDGHHARSEDGGSFCA
jgi:dTDP-4-amino-4,6-dideoxygalactose transaminase